MMRSATRSAALYPSLSEQLLPRAASSRSGLLRAALLCVGFSAFVAAMAQVSILLPFTPVPITGQTLAVLLAGVALGPRLGFGALVLYLTEGAAGLPVFAGGAAGPAVFAGPTGGYLVAFPLAAALAGALAVRGWDRRPVWTAGAMLGGALLIFGFGATWLGVWLALAGKFTSLAAVLQMGVLPFLPGEALKIALATVLLPTAWRLVGRGKTRE